MNSRSTYPTQAATLLRPLGFRTATAGDLRQSVLAFQGGWNLGPKLGEDGLPGVKTMAALVESEGRRRARQPTASPHFGFAEFACTCGGRNPACRLILVRRELLVGLEDYRERCSPSGVVIVSGYRCPDRNREVGGAGASMHMRGMAADFKPVATLAAVTGLREFGGIGYQRGTGLARHADTRPAADLARPTTWEYAA